MSDTASKLVTLLEQRRERLARWLGKNTLDPITLKPGFTIKDPYPKGMNASEADAFTCRTGLALPDDLKAWLTISNAPPGFFGIEVTSDASIEGVWRSFPDWLQRGWIPIGTDDFGNYYVRVVQHGSASRGGVCFVEALSAERLEYTVATDALCFAEFRLEQMAALNEGKRYGWPFDREFVLSKNPGLAKSDIAPLAWETIN